MVLFKSKVFLVCICRVSVDSRYVMEGKSPSPKKKNPSSFNFIYQLKYQFSDFKQNPTILIFQEVHNHMLTSSGDGKMGENFIYGNP